jgi:hypothetical protein
MRCYHCERELIWQSQLDTMDFDQNYNTHCPVIVTFLHCKHCPCDVEVKFRMPPEYTTYDTDEENPFTREIPEQDPNAAICQEDIE